MGWCLRVSSSYARFYSRTHHFSDEFNADLRFHLVNLFWSEINEMESPWTFRLHWSGGTSSSVPELLTPLPSPQNSEEFLQQNWDNTSRVGLQAFNPPMRQPPSLHVILIVPDRQPQTTEESKEINVFSLNCRPCRLIGISNYLC